MSQLDGARFLLDASVSFAKLATGASAGVRQGKLLAGRTGVLAFSSGTSSSATVTSQISGSATTFSPQTALTALGVYTGTVANQGDPKRVILRKAGTDQGVDDGTGDDVYGVLTQSGGVYTLSYKNAAGSAYTFASSISLDFFYVEIFDLDNMPVASLLSDSLSGALDVGTITALTAYAKLNVARLYTATWDHSNDTYDNGSGGVGATLTANGNMAVPNVDSATPALNDQIFINNPADQEQNGLWKVTTVGDGSTPYVLTRALSFDEAGEMVYGTPVYVVEGNAFANTAWLLQAAVATIGTDPVAIAEISPSQSVLTETTELFTLNGTDISNKYVTLAHAPAVAGNVKLSVAGEGAQLYSVDYTMGTSVRVSWDTLGLDGLLVSGDKVAVNYAY